MTNKRLNGILIALIACVILAGVWLHGQRRGAQEAFELVSDQLSSDVALATIDQLQTMLQRTEQELTEAVNAAETSAARTRMLRDLLDQQMRDRASDEAELALYRRIEASEKPNSIEIESLRWSASQPLMLELTLIQWQGRDRVKGDVVVTLMFKGGHAVGLGDSDGLMVDLEAVDFDFRFLQTLSIPMLPLSAEGKGSGNGQIATPHYVDVVIIPANGHLGPIDTRFMWSDVAQ